MAPTTLGKVTAGTMNMAEPVRLTHVEGQKTRLANLSQDLHKEIEQLEQRLCSVLSPSEPSPEGPGKPSEVLVPHANELREIADRIQTAIAKVRFIYDRLEIT